MDILEWKNHPYLLIVYYYYYSRWIEIAHWRQTASSAITEHIKSVFAQHGIPEIVVSDNGPQFSFWDFVQFAKSYCFTHLRSSPVHPQGNREAERAAKTIKMLLNKADDKYIALLNYRSTLLQHRSSPVELLMGRKLRTRIPTLPMKHISEGKDSKQFREIDAKLKQRQKENFDRQHRTRPLSRLTEGQPVWIKMAVSLQAVVISQYSTQHSTAADNTM